MDRTRLVGSASEALRLGWSILAVVFALSFVVNLLRLTGPMFMILVYDRVLPSRSEETLVALFAMLVMFLLAQAVMDYARRRILARFGAQFQERLEISLLAQAGPGDAFAPGSTKPVAGLDDVDGLRGFFHSASLIAVFDFFWAPMFVLVVFVLDPLLGWVCLGGMAAIFALVLLRMGLMGRRQADSDAAGRSVTDLRTMIAASRNTIRSQGLGSGFAERWLAARRNARDGAVGLKDWTGWFDALCSMTVLLTRYSVLAVGAWLTLQGQLTIGALVAATFLVMRALVPVEGFLTDLPQIMAAKATWARLRGLTDAKLADADDGVASDAGHTKARLSLVNLAVRNLRNGELLIKAATLDVAAGQMVQICGGSGKGKTLLAETIMGLGRRPVGTILISGQNLWQLEQGARARVFGYVPEQPGFVAGSLAENIARLEPDANSARVAAAARRACLHAIISALPDGYQTQIDAQASGFSRGQRAQLALARAVYHMPQVLILDEPDAILTEVMPKTLEKTFDQILQAGGVIVIFGRKPLMWSQISASYQIDQGRLRAVRTTANNAEPAARLVILPDKAARGNSAGLKGNGS